MIEYGTTRSAVKPEEIEICETKVFTATDIVEVNEDGADEQPGFSGYEYTLTEYSKDEYIRMQAEKNTELENGLTQTQEAITEVYEMMM